MAQSKSKGKSRRVDDSDYEEAAPSARMETDEEDGATQRRSRDKGKGKAGPSNGRDASSTARRDVQEVVDSDQDEQEDDQAANGEQAEAEQEASGDISIDNEQGARSGPSRTILADPCGRSVECRHK